MSKDLVWGDNTKSVRGVKGRAAANRAMFEQQSADTSSSNWRGNRKDPVKPSISVAERLRQAKEAREKEANSYKQIAANKRENQIKPSPVDSAIGQQQSQWQINLQKQREEAAKRAEEQKELLEKKKAEALAKRKENERKRQEDAAKATAERKKREEEQAKKKKQEDEERKKKEPKEKATPTPTPNKTTTKTKTTTTTTTTATNTAAPATTTTATTTKSEDAKARLLAKANARMKGQPPKSVSAPASTGKKVGLGSLWEQRMNQKGDEEYDKSREVIRARRAAGAKHVDEQIRKLIVEIKRLADTHGVPNPPGVEGLCKSIPFGVLFTNTMGTMSELSATCNQARKRNVVVYKGFMLAQGVSDDVLITLIADKIEDSAVFKSKRMAREQKTVSANAKCDVCKKTAYVTERILVNKLVLHKTCFKCADCKRTLKLADYSFVSNTYYCKQCFMKAFQSAGSLDFKN